MIRQAPRLLLRSSIPLRAAPTHRFLSTAPPAQKLRSLKNYAARLAIGVGVIYYYNTSQVFAEEPPFSIPPPQCPTEENSPQTLESIAIKNRTPPPPTPAIATSQASLNASSNSTTPVSKAPVTPPSSTKSTTANSAPTPPASEGLQETEEQTGQEGAFNEETGEINWDCPCLGGMAHGPCGDQFREAFSCFIFSKDEPKGMDCIPNFKNMQDCFREHPDIYGAELDDDEEAPEHEEAPPAPAPVSVEGGEVPAAAVSTEAMSMPGSAEGGEVPAAALSTASTPTPSSTLQSRPATSSSTEGEGVQKGEADEGSVLVPKAAHDATDANVGK